MAFPTTLTNAVDNDTNTAAAQLNNLEAKVGIDGSTVVTSLDYLLKNPASIDPGHKHSKLWASDGSPEAVTVDAAGNVGIGTVSPVARLDIRNTNGSGIGALSIVSADPNGAGIDLDPTGAYRGLLIRGPAVGNNIYGSLDIGHGATVSAGAYGLYVHGPSYLNGNVGIGMVSPVISGTGKLHMAADTFRLDTDRTPASAGAAGNAGEICGDANYIYRCVATNTWKRAALSTW